MSEWVEWIKWLQSPDGLGWSSEKELRKEFNRKRVELERRAKSQNKSR